MRISRQLILSLIIIFGVSVIAQGKQHKARYKVENCDCLGFDGSIPTFLSDLQGGNSVQIYGEADTRPKAEKEANNMCVETYRNFASEPTAKEDAKRVTSTGCQVSMLTKDGEWRSI